MKKVVLIIIAAVIVVGIGGVFLLLSNLNSIVAKVIEDQGGRVTETEVAVSGVDISLREGRATIAGLSVASPEGFAASSAFSLGEITVDIDLESLRGEPIIIEEIRVKAPEVFAEVLQNGSSNIDELRRNTQRFATSQGGAGGDGEAPADQKRIRIKRFVFAEGRIEVDATGLGLEKRSLTLPSIAIDEIGGADGALPDEIALAVLDALTRKATAEIAKAGLEDKARDLVEDAVGDKVQGLLDKVGR